MSSDSENDHNKQSKSLFLAEVSGVTPLVQDRIISPSKKNHKSHVADNQTELSSIEIDLLSQLSDEYDPFDDVSEHFNLNYHHSSIDKRQFKDLKTGVFDEQATLDLHGMNRQTAKLEIVQFLLFCQQHHFKHVCIMPGYGHGVLRKSLNLWLRQISDVLAYAESPQGYGGKGKIRLLLKSIRD